MIPFRVVAVELWALTSLRSENIRTLKWRFFAKTLREDLGPMAVSDPFLNQRNRSSGCQWLSTLSGCTVMSYGALRQYWERGWAHVKKENWHHVTKDIDAKLVFRRFCIVFKMSCGSSAVYFIFFVFICGLVAMVLSSRLTILWTNLPDPHNGFLLSRDFLDLVHESNRIPTKSLIDEIVSERSMEGIAVQ